MVWHVPAHHSAGYNEVLNGKYARKYSIGADAARWHRTDTGYKCFASTHSSVYSLAARGREQGSKRPQKAWVIESRNPFSSCQDALNRWLLCCSLA